MRRTKVKICGITNLEDALVAIDLGADALGFIFAAGSKRRVSPSTVRAVVSGLPPFASLVGVFVNASLGDLHAIMEETRLNIVQLHGDESPEYVGKIQHPVIKTFRPRAGFALSSLNDFKAQAFLFDTYAEGQYGGTGARFDWNLVRGAAKHGPIILSGGISSANAGEAIRTLRPYALDVSSSVETVPGKKDRHRLKEFFEAVHEADREEGSPC